MSDQGVFFSVILRADGSQYIGLGHLMRVKALYFGLKFQGVNVKILTAKNAYSEEIFEDERGVIYLNEKDKHSPSNWPKADLYIVDLYEYKEKFYQVLKQRGGKVVLFDDMEKNLPASIDGVINHNVYGTCEVYSQSKVRFCGPKYFLLREEVRNFTDEHVCKSNILVCMGGSDPEQQTARMVQLLRMSTNRTIDVVIDERTKETEKLKEDYNNINLHERPKNFVELMANSKYALTGAGTMAYELAYLGIPMLLVVLAENQQKIASSFVAKGAGVNLGHYMDINGKTIFEHVQRFEDEVSLLDKLAKNGRNLIDGKGPDRLAKGIIQNCIN